VLARIGIYLATHGPGWGSCVNLYARLLRRGAGGGGDLGLDCTLLCSGNRKYGKGEGGREWICMHRHAVYVSVGGSVDILSLLSIYSKNPN